MSSEAQALLPLNDDLPLLVLRRSGKTIAVTSDDPAAGRVLPFSPRACEEVRLRGAAALQGAREGGLLDAAAHEWPVRTKVRVSLDPVGARAHWLVVLPPRDGEATGGRGVTAVKSFRGDAEGVREVVAWMRSLRLEGACELCLASEPVLSEGTVTGEIGRLRIHQAEEEEEDVFVNERVFLGDSTLDIALALEDFLWAFFIDGVTSPTAVFWPSQLTYPVNIHYKVDELRIREHGALLLPMRPLLRSQQRLKNWSTTKNFFPAPATCVARTGESWERHLVPNIHTDVARGSALAGGELCFTSGMYDYYHYSVDGFKDEGWGCAYRSLQTVLSWFQYEGLMNQPMPNIRSIQKILSLKDPDKLNREGFVGSRDWIGSFEVMIVIQHYILGMECTIRRMESGSDLDTDPLLQQLLVNHFRQKRACPIMIGGSSYAHTIVGVDINLATMEARYLIVDPHYSSGKTEMRTAIKKGYVGWKEAGKFFEAKSWYNLCIPQLASYDPR